MVINTSFNVKDEPIVCTPEDAVRCFLNTEMDVLAIGAFIVRKGKAGE
jgi:carbamoyltransferase